MEDYIKCEMIGEGSPSLLNTFNNLFIVAVHLTCQYMLSMYSMLSTTK